MEQRFDTPQLETIAEITKALFDNSDHRKTLTRVLQILHERARMQRGMLAILRDENNGKDISLEVSFGLEPHAKTNVHYSLGEGVTGKVIQSGKAIAIHRLSEDTTFLDRSGARKNLKQELSFLCVPIKYRHKIIGALSVDTKAPPNKQELNKILVFLEFIVRMLASYVFRFMIEEENDRLKRILSRNLESNTIVGNCPAVRDMIFQIRQVADTKTTVLVTGETGTGKELVADEIHRLSPRQTGPLIKLNCGAIPENLVESELFGHEKGSFTGATQQRIGKFEQANGGTIFLDEIGELPMPTQVKLLRVLQDKTIERIGGKSTISVNVRVIAATNRNLEEEVAAGNFRQDLFYRINVFHIHVPPLRNRGSDILLLSDYFTEKYSTELEKQVVRIDTPAIDMLMAYHWPGNVRELENCIERAVLLSKDSVIHAHNLPPSLQMKATDQQKSAKGGTFEVLTRNYEIELITDALKTCRGNQTIAAKQLGITKRIIQYKIKCYDIDYKRFRTKH